jgi:hypothetical protein
MLIECHIPSTVLTNNPEDMKLKFYVDDSATFNMTIKELQIARETLEGGKGIGGTRICCIRLSTRRSLQESLNKPATP